MLREAANITRPAISLVLSLDGARRAVEWLEQGRRVIWGQLLHLTTPLDELWLASPDLADQFERLSGALLESSAARDVSSPFFGERGEEESIEQQA